MKRQTLHDALDDLHAAEEACSEVQTENYLQSGPTEDVQRAEAKHTRALRRAEAVKKAARDSVIQTILARFKELAR